MKTNNNPEWQGYTLDELRFAREINNARLEFATHKLKQMTAPYSTPSRAAGTIFGRIVNAMSYVDYIILGYRAISHIRRWFKK